MISNQKLSDMAWKSTDLLERMEKTCLASARKERTSETVRKAIETWAGVVAQGDFHRFEKRLAWSNVTLREVKSILDSNTAESEELPDWALTLREMINAAVAWTPQFPVRFLSKDDPIPFEDIFAPAIGWASAKWQDSVGTARHRLSRSSVIDAERFLMTRLVERSGAALVREFAEFAPTPLCEGSDEAASAPLGSSNYDDFVEFMLKGGLVEFLVKYPVLARQIGSQVQFWIKAMTEFTVRLTEDFPLLESTFGGGLEIGRIRQMRLGVGDPHEGGRSPVILVFESGLRVVYKPRDMSLEGAWAGLLSWLNDRMESKLFRPLTVIERNRYGWMEFANHQTIDKTEEGTTYYENAGRLLCLAYLLDGVDCHCENLVVCGLDPVLVDLETIMQPYPKRVGRRIQESRRSRSVMRTGFLPRWNSQAGGGRPLDLSGLGCQSPQESRYAEWNWRQINTDGMTLEPVPMKIAPRVNRTFAEDSSLAFSDFQEALVGGFQEMYRRILGEKAVWLSQPEPVSRFRGCAIRVLLRGTATYWEILHKAAEPELLRDGITWSIHADRLSSVWLDRDERPLLWPILPQEHRALIVGDIPRFETAADSTDLPLPDGTVLHGCFEQSSYEHFLDRLASLNEQDLAIQSSKIRESVATWKMCEGKCSEVDLFLAAILAPD